MSKRMFKAIIVDDEPMILESLLLGVNWNQLGVEVVHTFTDGTRALEYVKSNIVDIVITDVNMPPFSGLVLCSHIIKLNPTAQFIIISGYADFSYAQKSMQFGAVGYCLKPIDYNELSGYVKKAVKRLSPTIKRQHYDFIEYLYENNVSQLREYLSENGIGDQLYLGISIGKSNLVNQFGEFDYAIGLNEHLYVSGSCLANKLSDKELADPNLQGVSVTLKPITCDQLRDVTYATLYNAYQFFFEPDKKLFIAGAIYNSDFLEAAKMLYPYPDELKSYLKKEPVNHINIAAMLYASVQCYTGNETALHSYNQLIYMYNDYQCMADNLVTLLASQSESPPEYESSNRKFLEMLQYINENFAEDISMQIIADKLSLNMSYLSQLFKKEAGTTFVKYLTDIRLNKAKELLRDTELQLNEISESCGFRDYFYFIKQFKKYANETPTSYRKKYGVGQ